MEKKYRIYLRLLIVLFLSLILFKFYLENKKLSLINNDFLLTNIKPSSIKKNICKSEKELYEIEIECGDEFLQKGDELFIKIHNFIPFKNGKAIADIKFKNDVLKFAPILYLIRNNNVYIKGVKESSKLFKKTKSYKILICDSFNRVIPD